MVRAGVAVLRLFALSGLIYAGIRTTAFVAASAQYSAGGAGHIRGAPSQARPVHSRYVVNAEASHASESVPSSSTSLAFSAATFLPSLLFAARSSVSVVSVLTRHAKAPVSDFQAPTGARNFQEMTLGFTSDIAKNNLGESLYRPWVPYVSTIFLFIFGCNWSGALVPWKLLQLPEGELAAPTNNINTTVALSLLTSLAYFGGGLFRKGLGYFARYVKPTPILLPINILEDFTKPLSLSFRLFGNVLADELTVAVLTFLVPFVIPLPIMGLGLFAGSIQALIFATLASAYIAEACE